MGYLCWNCVMYIILAWYADEVLPSDYGVKRSACFCFHKKYWFSTIYDGADGAGGADGDDDANISFSSTTSDTFNNSSHEQVVARHTALSSREYVPSTDLGKRHTTTAIAAPSRVCSFFNFHF